VRHALQCVEEALRLAQVGQRLAPAQVGMHVHDADLAPEERAAFGALEQPSAGPPVGHGAVKQARAVRAGQVLAR
jgi:hypothetical protein